MPPVTPTIICLIAGVGLTLAAAAAAVFFVRRRRPEPPETVVAAGIARHAKQYDGLYEGLFQILAHEEALDRDTLKEWCGRTSQIEGEPEYTAAFRELFDSALDAPEKEYRKRLAVLLDCIAKAGITRVEAKTIPYDVSVRSSYIFLGNDVPADGTACNVIKPCWMLEDQTVEQGVIMKGEP